MDTTTLRLQLFVGMDGGLVSRTVECALVRTAGAASCKAVGVSSGVDRALFCAPVRISGLKRAKA